MATDLIPVLVECGCCGSWHRQDCHGDCRNDSERFHPDDFADQHGYSEAQRAEMWRKAVDLDDQAEEE